MKRNTIIIVLLIVLIGTYTIASTYSVIIDVTDENGIKEMIGKITPRDLFVDSDLEYNNLYYDIRRELNLTEEDANILMDSSYVNNNLQVILKSIVDYKANNDESAKLSNEQILALIEEAVNSTNNVDEDVKKRIIDKSYFYKNDISDYLYNIDINLIED